MKYLLFGDAESPHLLKWARALAAQGPAVFEGFELWAASSRGFLPAFDNVIAAERRLPLGTQPRFDGGNVALLRELPRLAAWAKRIRPAFVHAHYLSSHGTLGWLAQTLLGVRAPLIGSAWGSDILDTPLRSKVQRALLRRVLAACALTTSDSRHMAERMRALGAREVMVFPFGLEALPPPAPDKHERLFFANRGLETLYAPGRVLAVFAAIQREWPDAQLVIANDGSLRATLAQQVKVLDLGDAVHFTGRLDAVAQADWYRRAQWYLSLPRSDSVSVSVLEAMAHGCIPILSDLPANRELVETGLTGLIVPDVGPVAVADLDRLQQRATAIAADNRAWVAEQALFGPSVERFLLRLAQMPH